VERAVGRRERLGVALGLVVHAARAYWIDVHPVRLLLRVHLGSPYVSLVEATRKRATFALASPRLERPYAAGLQRLDWEPQVIDGRGRTGEVQDEVHRFGDIDVVRDVVLDESQVLVGNQVLNVGLVPGPVVDHDDLESVVEETFAEVRPQEPGASGNHHLHSKSLSYQSASPPDMER
jgi:hypothetical protein